MSDNWDTTVPQTGSKSNLIWGPVFSLMKAGKTNVFCIVTWHNDVVWLTIHISHPILIHEPDGIRTAQWGHFLWNSEKLLNCSKMDNFWLKIFQSGQNQSKKSQNISFWPKMVKNISIWPKSAKKVSGLILDSNLRPVKGIPNMNQPLRNWV